jgi:hypothetical protein
VEVHSVAIYNVSLVEDESNIMALHVFGYPPSLVAEYGVDLWILAGTVFLGVRKDGDSECSLFGRWCVCPDRPGVYQESR